MYRGYDWLGRVDWLLEIGSADRYVVLGLWGRAGIGYMAAVCVDIGYPEVKELMICEPPRTIVLNAGQLLLFRQEAAPGEADLLMIGPPGRAPVAGPSKPKSLFGSASVAHRRIGTR